MLLFSPDVEEWFQWFDLTYQLQVGLGWVLWQRCALPHEGGLGDQPAKLLEAITFIGRQRNELLRREMRHNRRTDDER